jgi:hypothetical protein
MHVLIHIPSSLTDTTVECSNFSSLLCTAASSTIVYAAVCSWLCSIELMSVTTAHCCMHTITQYCRSILCHIAIQQVGVDEDIMVEPALYLWPPTAERDKPWRKFQHLLWPIPYSITFALWRFDSIRNVIDNK